MSVLPKLNIVGIIMQYLNCNMLWYNKTSSIWSFTVFQYRFDFPQIKRGLIYLIKEKKTDDFRMFKNLEV